MEARRIAIDGPAGAGKSTLGELLAHKLGFLYIDTGAMYRAVAWLALQHHLDLQTEAALVPAIHKNAISILRPTVHDSRQYTVLCSGQDITWDIRTAAVTRAVPVVSAHPGVRSLLIAQQRTMAERDAVVMVGRDIGTVVLPDAELKIYLDASAEVRAQRRHAELVSRQGTSSVSPPSLAEVLQDIRRRDALDSANMQPASDAVTIVTDNFSVQEVLDEIMQQLLLHTHPVFL